MPVLVASKQLRPSDLAVDETHVYWIALDGDGVVWRDHFTIRRIPKAVCGKSARTV